ncbi:MAG: COQ9 family protein [Silicimonas sp.]|nr:COQ9 family protein [Silicimonas sp.]NNE79219.1 COQ9 family protein [Silicimonas sp.]
MTDKSALDRLLDAGLPHVAFDGWSDTMFEAARRESGLTPQEARTLAPRGAVDLAVALHRRGDAEMVARMAEVDISDMRYRDRVATALVYRVEALPDREAVRRATALFALPVHGVEGSRLIWETADAIWNALGDTSRDGNWYSKRATLSAVWGSVVLFWLGDDSPDHERTKAFIGRRIDNVMQIEAFKGRLRSNPLTKPMMDMQAEFFGRMRAPSPAENVPGRWKQN